MLAIGYAIRLLGFTLGACLDLFLIVILARKRGARNTEWLLAATLAATAVWRASNAIGLFQQANVGVANVPRLFEAASLWIALTLAVGTLCSLAARRGTDTQERRFLNWCAAAIVAVVVAGVVRGTDSAVFAIGSVTPACVLAVFVYRYNLFGLLISRRVQFALTLGVIFALYLLLIRRISGFVEEEYTALRDLTEVALIFAAALVWLPLYGWMTRFLSKRTQLYADFSKRVIEEAARILRLERRLQFLAEELGRTFALRRVLLAAAGEHAPHGEFGMEPYRGGSVPLGQIESLVREEHLDVVSTARLPDAPISRMLTGLGFTYLFPLWYEGHLTGLLFLDTSPRMFLDENEPILLGLSRQISHSIETARIIEEKIDLERALVRQEHLASLGTAAATIAHEIKNPLSSVRTLAQLMQEDREVCGKYDRDLGYMIGETDRLNRSVQQLLSFSKPVPEEWQEMDLTELLEDTARLLARQYTGELIRIEHRIEPGMKLKRGNPELIRQIVLNLVLNAVQVSQPGEKVCVTAEARPPVSIVIAVSDHGPGIPAGIRGRIFEPFFTTKQRGTGLGLAIVRKNVQHFGGEIRVESPSEGGRGTRVEVTMPVE